MTFEEYVHQVKKERLKENLTLLRKEIKSCVVQNRLAVWAGMYCFSKTEIEEKLPIDDLYAAAL